MRRGQVIGCIGYTEPCEDIPGEWYAECLTTGISTQGNSQEHAMEMLAEAVGMCVGFDQDDGLDPMDRVPMAERGKRLRELLAANNEQGVVFGFEVKA